MTDAQETHDHSEKVDYGDDSERLRGYAEKKYDSDGSQTLKNDPEYYGDGN